MGTIEYDSDGERIDLRRIRREEAAAESARAEQRARDAAAWRVNMEAEQKANAGVSLLELTRREAVQGAPTLNKHGDAKHGDRFDAYSRREQWERVDAFGVPLEEGLGKNTSPRSGPSSRRRSGASRRRSAPRRQRRGRRRRRGASTPKRRQPCRSTCGSGAWPWARSCGCTRWSSCARVPREGWRGHDPRHAGGRAGARHAHALGPHERHGLRRGRANPRGRRRRRHGGRSHGGGPRSPRSTTSPLSPSEVPSPPLVVVVAAVAAAATTTMTSRFRTTRVARAGVTSSPAARAGSGSTRRRGRKRRAHGGGGGGGGRGEAPAAAAGQGGSCGRAGGGTSTSRAGTTTSLGPSTTRWA